MMSARDDTTLNCGRHLLIALTVSQSLLSLMKKFYACMEGSLLSFPIWNRFEES
jgi:hypothetical protein